MCAIDINGVLGHEMISGAYDGEKFKLSIEKYLVPYFERNVGSILIMDNCQFHKRQDVLRILNENRISSRFNPPYSPQLNSIEEFFGALKANYKAIIPRPFNIAEIKIGVENAFSGCNISFFRLFEQMKTFFS